METPALAGPLLSAGSSPAAFCFLPGPTSAVLVLGCVLPRTREERNQQADRTRTGVAANLSTNAHPPLEARRLLAMLASSFVTSSPDMAQPQRNQSSTGWRSPHHGQASSLLPARRISDSPARFAVADLDTRRHPQQTIPRTPSPPALSSSRLPQATLELTVARRNGKRMRLAAPWLATLSEEDGNSGDRNLEDVEERRGWWSSSSDDDCPAAPPAARLPPIGFGLGCSADVELVEDGSHDDGELEAQRSSALRQKEEVSDLLALMLNSLLLEAGHSTEPPFPWRSTVAPQSTRPARRKGVCQPFD